MLEPTWLSNWLHQRTFWLFYILTLCMIATLFALYFLSRANNGLAAVNDHAITIAHYRIGLGLVWSSLPVALFQIYGLCIAAIVQALSARQPYVALYPTDPNSKEGAPAQTSILLDYNSYWAFTTPYYAFKNKHYILAALFFSSILLNLSLPALGSHIFVPVSTKVSNPIQVRQSHTFAHSGFGLDLDLTAELGVASSIAVYGGKPPTWTTSNLTFLPVEIPQVSTSSGRYSTLVVPTEALSATLDCRALGPSEFQLRPIGSTWRFLARDRGCYIDDTQFANNPLPTKLNAYIRTYTNLSCPIDTGGVRIAVITALNSNDSRKNLTNTTAVSCEPHYRHFRGLLNVTLGTAPDGEPTITGFIPAHGTGIFKTNITSEFEVAINVPRVLNAAATFDATDFGAVIYSYTKKHSSDDLFRPEVVRRSIEKIYSTTFVAFVNQQLLRPATPTMLPATLITIETRLIVVLELVIPVICLLCGVLVMLFVSSRYVRTHKSILYEEPKALIGAAAILRDSQLMADLGSMTRSTKAASEFCQNQNFIKKGWIFNGQTGRIESTKTARPL